MGSSRDGVPLDCFSRLCCGSIILAMSIPNKVTIVEVGPRDGFQMEKAFIPTKLKVSVIDSISRAGIGKIEAASFVSPKVVPQMQDAEIVLKKISRLPGVIYSALVPNLRGAKLAVDAGADAVRVVVCATEHSNQRNVGLSVAKSLSICKEIFDLGLARSTAVEAIVAMAFGCPFEGKVKDDTLVSLVNHLVASGFQEISIADSIGVANPVQVRQTMRNLLKMFPDAHFSLHLHNTRGLGLANVLAALEEGVDTYDSSIGGLGGCPVVPGGAGNISTEDLVNLLVEMGISTGVSIEEVMVASKAMEGFLGRTLPSLVLAVGTPAMLYGRMTRYDGVEG
jgi:hydroxymethylglutaryl-CoA lyase